MSSQALKDLKNTLDSTEGIAKGMQSIQKDGGDPNGDIQKGEASDDDDGDEDDDEDYPVDGDLEKGLGEDDLSKGALDADLEKALSDSPAMSALVKAIDGQMGEQAELIKGVLDEVVVANEGSELLAKAMTASLNLSKALVTQVETLSGQVQALSKALRQPNSRRGAINAAEADVINKSLLGQGSGEPAEDREAVKQQLIKAIEAGRVDGIHLHRYVDLGQALPADVKKALS